MTPEDRKLGRGNLAHSKGSQMAAGAGIKRNIQVGPIVLTTP